MAYLDKNLSSLKNEIWESIPGVDGYYEVSCFGRIKRLSRELFRKGPKGCSYILPEKIISPGIQKTPNKLNKDFTHQLSTHFTIENRKYHFSVRRLVYYCFVKEFDIDNPGIFVISKNGNSFDIRPSNLQLVDSHERLKEIYKKGRMISAFKGKRNIAGTTASLKITCKQVSQYDLKGNLIQTFSSISEASRKTGIPHSLISHVLNHRQNKTRQFYFAYGAMKKFDYQKILQQKALGRKEKRGTKVAQYSTDNQLIATYLSIEDAGKSLGKTGSNISANLRGITKSAYGFIWKKI